MYGTSTNGPGALVIFDVRDPPMAPATAGVAVSAGAIQNVKLTQLFTMDEIMDIRKNAAKIGSIYQHLDHRRIQGRPPGIDPPQRPRHHDLLRDGEAGTSLLTGRWDKPLLWHAFHSGGSAKLIEKLSKDFLETTGGWAYNGTRSAP